MSSIRIPVLVAGIAALASSACAPWITSSSALRMEERIEPRCIAENLRSRPGVSWLRGVNPMNFRFAPSEEDRVYRFRLEQDVIRFAPGWWLNVSGSVDEHSDDQVAAAHVLQAHTTAIRDAVAQACNAQIIDDDSLSLR